LPQLLGDVLRMIYLFIFELEEKEIQPFY